MKAENRMPFNEIHIHAHTLARLKIVPLSIRQVFRSIKLCLFHSGPGYPLLTEVNRPHSQIESHDYLSIHECFHCNPKLRPGKAYEVSFFGSGDMTLSFFAKPPQSDMCGVRICFYFLFSSPAR